MITRREGLAWLAAATAALPQIVRAQTVVSAAVPTLAQVAPWPVTAISPLTGPGYGSDPDLMNPKATWPLTLTHGQKPLTTLLCDLILPKDETSPGAGEAGVADFIDEWVSAPYPTQAADRDQILRGLSWLDAQAVMLGAKTFADAPMTAQTRILDAIATGHNDGPLAGASGFFSRLKVLVIVGYYTLPEGKAAMGYIGNQPVSGPYPGPTPEAMNHFHALLAKLNLKDPGQPWQVV